MAWRRGCKRFVVIPAKAGIQWFLPYILAAGGNDNKQLDYWIIEHRQDLQAKNRLKNFQ